MSLDLKVVSNAGPFMVLAKLNLLYLLKGLYGRVYFSNSVYDELVTEGIQQGYQDAYTFRWFHAKNKGQRRLLRRVQKTHPCSQRHALMSLRGGRQADEAIPPPAGEEIASLRSQRQTGGGDCFSGCKNKRTRARKDIG